jgi:hypothetical protein
MPMVVVHVASGTRNILVFLGRMAEAMGHALHCHSPAPIILQYLPFSSAGLRPAKTYPSRSAQAGLEVPSESYPNA